MKNLLIIIIGCLASIFIFKKNSIAKNFSQPISHNLPTADNAQVENAQNDDKNQENPKTQENKKLQEKIKDIGKDVINDFGQQSSKLVTIAAGTAAAGHLINELGNTLEKGNQALTTIGKNLNQTNSNIENIRGITNHVFTFADQLGQHTSNTMGSLERITGNINEAINGTFGTFNNVSNAINMIAKNYN